MLINAILLDMIIEEDNIFSLFFLKIFKKIVLVIRLLLLGQKGGHYEVAYSFDGLFCLITYSNTAQATDWYYVSPDDKGNQLFIDNDSVQKSDYDAVLWLKVNEPGGE